MADYTRKYMVDYINIKIEIKERLIHDANTKEKNAVLIRTKQINSFIYMIIRNLQ